jgi:predicted nucleic acid-binding protein
MATALTTPIRSVIKEDQDDNKILECAATAKSDYIVSENKDLLRLRSFKDTTIINLQAFVVIPLRRERSAAPCLHPASEN